jgi:small subunit ribosomal protein S9
MEIINTIGRRKTAVARIYMSEGSGTITINKKDYKEYFAAPTLQYKIDQAFNITDLVGKFDVKVNVDGGGITGQAEAIRLAISRALCELDAEGLLTRDPRMVERKKPGQKKARKKFQFSKR